MTEPIDPRNHVAVFLAMRTPEAIFANVAERGAHMDSHVGQAAQIATQILVSRQIAATAVLLDKAATRLQRWALGLAWASLAVSVVALVVAVVA